MLTKFHVDKVTKIFNRDFGMLKRVLSWQTWCVASESKTQDSLETKVFPEDRAEGIPMREKVSRGRKVSDAFQAVGRADGEGRSPSFDDAVPLLWSWELKEAMNCFICSGVREGDLEDVTTSRLFCSVWVVMIALAEHEVF